MAESKSETKQDKRDGKFDYYYEGTGTGKSGVVRAADREEADKLAVEAGYIDKPNEDEQAADNGAGKDKAN